MLSFFPQSGDILFHILFSGCSMRGQYQEFGKFSEFMDTKIYKEKLLHMYLNKKGSISLILKIFLKIII